jgi:hypothetical protein
MCNAAGAPAGRYAHELADRLITDFPPTPPLDTAKVDAAAFAKLAGVYRNQRTHSALVLGADPPSRLRALADGWYWNPGGTRWQFQLGPGGTPTALRMAQPDGDTVVYAYAAAARWTPTAQQLQEYAGTYRSDELDVGYDMQVANDTLIPCVPA